jgi:hypothetical protein
MELQQELSGETDKNTFFILVYGLGFRNFTYEQPQQWYGQASTCLEPPGQLSLTVHPEHLWLHQATKLQDP